MPYEQGTVDHPLHGRFFSNVFLGQGKISFVDCQGKVCLYNGTLDLNTCKCKCSAYASGSQCERRNEYSFSSKYQSTPHIFFQLIVQHYLHVRFIHLNRVLL